MATLNLKQATSSGGLKVNSSPQMTGKTNASSFVPSAITDALNKTLGFGAVKPKSPVSSGGGGSASPQVWDDNARNAGGGASFDQASIDSAINDLYGSSYDYLNQAENQLRNDLPNTLKEAQTNYDTNAAGLGQQRTSALGQFDLQQNQAGQQNESALAAARRLYSELQQGYGQRFGGSSSAGQAASEIAGVEQQRQQGQMQQNYGNVLQQIGQQRSDVEGKYQQGLLQLEQTKQTAINQANRDFQQKLLDIANNRAQIGAAKAQARLSALQDLRNQVFAINQQNTQFQQALDLQRQQSSAQLQQYQQQAGQGVGTGQTAVNTYANQPAPTSNLITGGGQQQQQSQYVGSVSPHRTQDQGLFGQMSSLFGGQQNQPDFNRFPHDGFSY